MNPPSPSAPVDSLSNQATTQSPEVYASHNVTSVFQAAPADSPAPQGSATPSVATPLSAADGDVIEKAWVQKAQAVMEKNKYDPYTLQIEAQQLSQVYLKQRFGLDVGLPKEKR